MVGRTGMRLVCRREGTDDLDWIVAVAVAGERERERGAQDLVVESGDRDRPGKKR